MIGMLNVSAGSACILEWGNGMELVIMCSQCVDKQSYGGDARVGNVLMKFSEKLNFSKYTEFSHSWGCD